MQYMHNLSSSTGEEHCRRWCTIKKWYLPYRYGNNSNLCLCQVTRYVLNYNYHLVWGDTTVTSLVMVVGHDVGTNLDKVTLTHKGGITIVQHLLYRWPRLESPMHLMFSCLKSWPTTCSRLSRRLSFWVAVTAVFDNKLMMVQIAD